MILIFRCCVDQTRKSNILDLIFCPSELSNTISVSDTFVSDHRMITVETNIPVHCVAPKPLLNPLSNNFANLDFHKADTFFVDTTIY